MKSIQMLPFLFLLLLPACMEDSPRKGRPLIEDYSSDTGTEEEEESSDVFVRPTDQIYIDSFCACLNGTSDILNNCDSYCASKPNNATPTLYVSVSLSDEILLNEQLGSLERWCNAEILNEDGEGDVSPSCKLRVTDGINSSDLDMSMSSGANAFTVNINELSIYTTYKATIVETVSGAKSKSFQLYRIDPDESSSTTTSPLQVIPISQYSCLTRSGYTSDSGDDYFEMAMRLHYYYASDESPTPLAAGNNFLMCHDPRLPGQGNTDSALYPRFELIEQDFYLWNKNDVRFYDVYPTDGVMDIHALLKQKLQDEYSITQDIDIFGEFRWSIGPESSDSNILMGYYMKPWLDSTTNRGFCPTQTHYYSSTPMFNVLREVLGGIDTEAIYLAVKEKEVLYDNDGNIVETPDDILIIREGLLKQIWFYYQNGQHYEPTEITAGQKTIMFYYPPDVNNPYIKQSTQKLYTVKSPENISSGTSSTTGLRTTISPPDKRFGCVPKHGE